MRYVPIIIIKATPLLGILTNLDKDILENVFFARLPVEPTLLGNHPEYTSDEKCLKNSNQK